MNAESLYAKLPIFLQNLACTFYGWREKHVRMGHEFGRCYDFLLTTENADCEAIEVYQNCQIADLISHAYRVSPYYKKLMDGAGLKPADISNRGELNRLPILRKDEVITHSKEILSTEPSDGPSRQSKTSGTTGTALKFYTTEAAVAFQWAVWWRHRKRFGFVPGEWHVNFTGKPVVPIDQKSPPFWRIDYARKQIIVTAAHLTQDKIAYLVDYLNYKNIMYFSGYPSQIAQFCSLVESEGLELSAKPHYVFPGAEAVQHFQKSLIERVLGATIAEQYGFSEGCGNASQCEHGNYHEDWEFGVLECLNGIQNSDGTITGKIVATGFANYVFPFIRYEIGDTATWAPEDYKCPCGRSSRVLLAIDGRSEDYVITPEGNRVMRFDYLFKETTGIEEAQIVQRTLGAIIVRYVPRATFEKSDLDCIRKVAREWISPGLGIEFEQVDQIPRTSSGKFKPVVSELRNSYQERH